MGQVGRRRARAVPGDGEHTAVGLHLNFGVEPAQTNAGHHRRTGTGATGQSFTNPTFVDSQMHAVSINHVRKPHVDPLRKTRVALQQGAQALNTDIMSS